MDSGALTAPTLALAALCLLAGCATASSNARPPTSVDPGTVDSLFAAYAGPDSPGASVVVIHDGKAVLSRAYGLADLDKRAPATPESNFRLASLSKQFTATAIMLLVQDGKLRLEERVVDVLPGFPAYLKEVRVHHLLQHTSGIWDYEDFVPSTHPVQVKDPADNEALAQPMSSCAGWRWCKLRGA